MPHAQFSIYSIQCSLVSKLALSNEQNKTSIGVPGCERLIVLILFCLNGIRIVTFKLIIEIENFEQTDACSEYYHGNTTSAKISPTSHKK
ncbi:hypothetical protein T09_15415 [Trichinella sp. T9]|nr:hypothetical protein T09_15415 [Trichinella sp. T9]